MRNSANRANPLALKLRIEHNDSFPNGTMVDLTNRQYTIEILAAMATLTLRSAHAVRALLLATVVKGHRTTDGIVLPPVRQAKFDQLFASAHEQLSAEVAAKTQAKGEAMTLAEAVCVGVVERILVRKIDIFL